MDKHQTIIAGALCAMLFGAAGFWLGRGVERGGLEALNMDTPTYSTDGATLPVNTRDAYDAALAGGNAIAINDQLPGRAVNASAITLSKDGWVVIHEERNGKPGNIIGAKRFNAGQNQSGTVELLRPTEEGKVYFAMLHSDDGDRQFDFTKDSPTTDQQENLIMMRFVATVAPTEQR